MTRLKTTILRLLKFINPVLMTAPFGYAWYEFYRETLYYEPFYRRGNYALLILFLVIYAYLAHIYEGYSVSTSKKNDIVLSQTLSIFITDCLMYVLTYMLARHLPNPLPLLGVFISQIIISFIWTWLVSGWYFAAFPKKKTTIIFDDRPELDLLIQKYGLDVVYDVHRKINVKDVISNLLILDDSDVIFFSGVHSHDRNVIIKYTLNKKTENFIIPRIGDVLMHGAKKVHMLHLPMLMVQRYNPTIEYTFIKRLFDLVVSLICLIVFSPLMIITAIAIRISDGGPALYKQVRLTKNGKKFKIYKFRSMRMDAEKDGVARLSTGDSDTRITPVGRIIRRFRIDEFPQLFNVIAGDMSLIGPRPERPEIAEEYMKKLPEYNLRLQTKAGMTGYAQIYGKYNSTPYDKLQLDLFYTINPSFIEDIRIIFSTIKILFIKESTDGIEEGKTNAAR